jgi:hypothetical protein
VSEQVEAILKEKDAILNSHKKKTSEENNSEEFKQLNDEISMILIIIEFF